MSGLLNQQAAAQTRGDVYKWRDAFAHFDAWDTPRQRKVQEQEARVITRWLIDLRLPRYDILEIGSGNGRVGKTVSKELLERGVDFSYCFSDLLPECVEKSRDTMKDFTEPHRLSFMVLDATEANRVLGERSQTIIISTGFVSAATSKHTLPSIAKTLKNDGVLIVDFINHFSPLVFLSQPIRSLQRAWNYTRNKGKSYHLGSFGIKEFFVAHGLLRVRHRAIRLRMNPLLYMFRKHHD